MPAKINNRRPTSRPSALLRMGPSGVPTQRSMRAVLSAANSAIRTSDYYLKNPSRVPVGRKRVRRP